MHVQYRGVAICIPNRGDTVSFWSDLIDERIHSQVFPNLFHFAKEPGISFWKLRSTAKLFQNPYDKASL
jgi:hypothetical protein